MQPQDPSPAPPPVVPNGQGQTQYDFIFNPNQQQKKPLIPLPDGKKGRLMIAGAIAVALIVVTIIVVGLINSAGKGDTQALVTAAKQQQELIRIAKIGVEKSRSQAAKNIAVTTQLALESEQDDMQAAIKTAGLNPKKVLTSSVDAETDRALTSAEQNNRFDEEFLTIITASLKDYQKSIKAAYDGATSKKLKAALITQFNSANTLTGVTAGTE